MHKSRLTIPFSQGQSSQLRKNILFFDAYRTYPLSRCSLPLSPSPLQLRQKSRDERQKRANTLRKGYAWALKKKKICFSVISPYRTFLETFFYCVVGGLGRTFVERNTIIIVENGTRWWATAGLYMFFVCCVMVCSVLWRCCIYVKSGRWTGQHPPK